MPLSHIALGRWSRSLAEQQERASGLPYVALHEALTDLVTRAGETADGTSLDSTDILGRAIDALREIIGPSY